MFGMTLGGGSESSSATLAWCVVLLSSVNKSGCLLEHPVYPPVLAAGPTPAENGGSENPSGAGYQQERLDRCSMYEGSRRISATT
jgi:hypothetical protein